MYLCINNLRIIILRKNFEFYFFMCGSVVSKYRIYLKRGSLFLGNNVNGGGGQVEFVNTRVYRLHAVGTILVLLLTTGWCMKKKKNVYVGIIYVECLVYRRRENKHATFVFS